MRFSFKKGLLRSEESLPSNVGHYNFIYASDFTIFFMSIIALLPDAHI